MEDTKDTQAPHSTESAAGVFPPGVLEGALEQILGLLQQEVIPVIGEGFLIEKTFTLPKVRKSEIKKIAVKMQAQMASLSQLDFRNVESWGEIWKLRTNGFRILFRGRYDRASTRSLIL